MEEPFEEELLLLLFELGLALREELRAAGLFEREATLAERLVAPAMIDLPQLTMRQCLSLSNGEGGVHGPGFFPDQETLISVCA